MSPSDKPAPIWFRGLQALAGFWTAFCTFLFLVMSASGPFSVETPIGKLSCTDRDRMLLYAVVGLALWQVLLGLRRRWADAPAGSAPVPAARRGEESGLSIFITVVVVALWIRRLYKSYVRVLFRMGTQLASPFWRSHLMHGAMLAACLYTWRTMKRTHGAVAALVAALLMALSSVYFSPTQGEVIASTVALLSWMAVSAMAGRGWIRGWGWGVAAGLAVVAGVVTRMLYPEHAGWAGNRLETMLYEYAAPESVKWLLLAGVVGCVLKREMPAFLAAALAIAAGGVVLAGGREPVGLWGASALVPLAAMLAGLGASHAWRNRWVQQSALGRNVVLLLLFSFVVRLAREFL